MGSGEQIYAGMLIVAGATLIPAGCLTLLFGGKGVFYTCCTITIATIGFGIWLLSTVTASTGMEGLALVFAAIALVAIWIGAFFGYAIVRIVKPV